MSMGVEKPKVEPTLWVGTFQRAEAKANNGLSLTLAELRELVQLTREMDEDAHVSVEIYGVTYNHPDERNVARLHVRKEKTG